MKFSLPAVLTFASLAIASAQSPQEPLDGRLWLQLNGLAAWEWDVDRDLDGMSNRQEYFAGTDPQDATSVLRAGIARDNGEIVVSWETLPEARYTLVGSEDLALWDSLLDEPVAGDGAAAEIGLAPVAGNRFFSVVPLEPGDRDGDGLSDREEAVLGTDPDLANTDGDRFDDGVEVFSTFTDPTVFDPEGGTISGRVFLDDDLSRDLTGAAPVAGTTVYLDLDFDGEMGTTDPRMETDDDGRYSFFNLQPGLYEVRQELIAGETQTVPAEITPNLPDRLADEVLSYAHAEGGPLEESYGYAPLSSWPGQDYVVLGARIAAVDPAVLLTPFGRRLNVPPIGSYPPNHFLTLPDGASVELRFDEIIYDGEGGDFRIGIPAQGFASEFEPGDLFFGPNAENVAKVAMDEVPKATFVEFDLGDFPEVSFVQYIRIESRTPAGPGQGGTDRGFGVGGFEAINVLPLSSSARRVRITDTEVFADEDFGKFFQDLPPSLLLSTSGMAARATVPFPLHLVANDDLGITSRTFFANGQILALDSEGKGEFTAPFPGELLIEATVTDTGGQTVSERWTVFVADENGVLPYDPDTLAEQQGIGKTRVQIFSPESGAVPTTDVVIVGSIVGETGEIPAWEVSYAAIDDIDPLDLATADPDYIEIGSGTGNVFSDAIGTFPVSSLADGIYFLKVVAQPVAGGEAVFLGQVIGVGIDPAALSTQVVITSPEPSATATLVQEVRGSITSGRPVGDWTVEIASRDEVDLSNIGAVDDDWEVVSTGTGAQEEVVLATLDTSMMRNGSYVLRISAYNDLRLGRAEAVLFEVMSNAKLGRNRLEFTDIELDLVGIPVAVTRIYDSFEKDTEGDFGSGWSLANADAEILETVPDTSPNIFGATSFKDGTRVYLTAPDGRRLAFTFRAELAATGFLGAVYRATFDPDPGNPYMLEVPEGDDGFLSLLPNGEVRLNFITLPWNPDIYILKTADGLSYTYDQRLGLRGIEDLNGNTLTFTPEGIAHSSGVGVDFTRDTSGRITGLTTPGGRVFTYTYDAAGDLVSFTEPSGATTTYSYSDTVPHYITGIEDPSGRMPVRYEYDADGRLAAIIDEDGNREEQSWDPAALTGTITDRRGNITELAYDNRGNVTRSTDPLGNTTTFLYENPDFPDTETTVQTENTQREMLLDALGNVTATYYSGDNLPVITLRNTYDDAGRITRRDALGGSTERFEYDEKGNLITHSPWIVAGNREARTYTPEGQVETITKNGETLRFTYDPVTGKPSHEEGLGGFARSFTYNAEGDIASITDSVGGTIGFAFSDIEGSATITDPRGGIQVGAYDSTTGVIVLQDQNGGTTRASQSTLGREQDRTLPDGQRVLRTFDAEENTTAIVVPGGHTNTFTYDELNRPIIYTDAAGETASTTYDAEGRVVARVDRNGKRTTYGYKVFGALAFERWHAPNGDVEREFTYTYSKSRISSVTDGTSTWGISAILGEDAPGRLSYTYAGQGEFELDYTWDTYREGVPTKIRYVTPEDAILDGEIRTNFVGDRVYGYQIDIDDTIAPDTSGSVRFSYDPMGRMEAIERFDFFSQANAFPDLSSATRIGRDLSGDILSIRHEDLAGDLLFPASEFTLTRDLVGQITGRTTPEDTATYSYDVMGQLLTAAHTTYADEAYTYDSGGNPAGGTYGADNRMLTFGTLTFIYDAEGNVTTRTDSATGDIRTYTYDHRNQLTSVSDATGILAEYAYDYIGRMMYREVGGARTWIVYDRDTPIYEFADGATIYNRVYFYDLGNPELQLGEWTPATGIRWYLTDQIGSIHGTVSSAGTPGDWLEYDAFGNPRTPAPVGFPDRRFAGRHWNAPAALYENTLRHYDPATRRFQQQDPVRYDSGDANLYRYATNNPISKTDPLGTTALTEYGLLVKKVSGCVKLIKPVGECIEMMLNAAAQAVQGQSSSVDVGCVQSSTIGLMNNGKGCQ